MELPQFLLADNTDQPESVFIVHTEFPRFVWNIVIDELEWMDDLSGNEEDLVEEIAQLLTLAESFYEREMKRSEAESE